MKRLYILTFWSVVAALLVARVRPAVSTTIAGGSGVIVPGQWLYTNKNPHTPAKDIRPADQTFLTFPEWYLVFSPNEQAEYFAAHTATTFPFMAHTAQIWESYKIVSDQIKGYFPLNKGYHFMIWVIGSSASAEYAVKSWYETLIGRVTNTTKVITEEDKFNAAFTKSYVSFIRDRPWYEYDFKRQLAKLWNDVPLAGSSPIRKAERRYILTSELLVKIAYGKLIGMGTKQVYEEAVPTTAVVLENDSLVYLPRYNQFMTSAIGLAEQGHTFKEIAGNTSAILLTVLCKEEQFFKVQNGITLFEQPVASDRSMKRVAIVTPVSYLSQTLTQFKKEDIPVEHIFDY